MTKFLKYKVDILIYNNEILLFMYKYFYIITVFK